MRQLLNKPWLVSALVAFALILAVMRSGQGAGLRDQGMAAVDPAGEPGTATFGGTTVPRPIEAALQALPPRKPVADPFAARPSQVVLPGFTETVRLSAIWTQGGATLVMVNDRILKAGDSIGSLRIESATQDGVWIGHGSGRDFLSLGETRSFSFPASPAPEQPL
jgi:hypothetical protein